jgi:hypothetical protein
VKRIIKKTKRSIPPKTQPKIDFSESHDHSHADLPLETGPLRSQDLRIKSQPSSEDISKCSPLSSEDFQFLTSSQPLNKTPSSPPPTNQRPLSPSAPSSRLRPRRIAPTYIRPVSNSTVLEPKMFRLAAVEDVLGVGKLCSLCVGEDGKVEGTLVVDNDEI